MISLDVSRAYDTCWRREVLNPLKTWKINRWMLGFAKNFMSNQTLKVAVGNTVASLMSIENGVVQEAVLGVTLFLVAMATICNGIENRQESLDTQMIGSYKRANGHHDWPKTSCKKQPALTYWSRRQRRC
jgi:hypothetical protein